MCKDDSSRAACQESLIFLKSHCPLMLHVVVCLMSDLMCDFLISSSHGEKCIVKGFIATDPFLTRFERPVVSLRGN